MQVNKKTFLISGGVIVFALLGTLNWILYSNIVSASTFLASVENKISALEEQKKEFSKFARTLKDLEKDIDTIEKSFAGEDNFVVVLRTFEGLAKDTGVKFSAESARVPVAETEEASVAFKIEGKFSQIMNFLVLADKIPYSGLVENLAIAPKADAFGKKSSVLEARINYLIFNFRFQ